MSTDTYLRSLRVLERALRSSRTSTRERAVAMLAHVDLLEREEWLARAEADRASSVRSMAALVAAWASAVPHGTWPEREEVADGTLAHAEPVGSAPGAPHPEGGWKWEYLVEVWREDAVPVGLFVTATCDEDDEHARRIALGQAVLAVAPDRASSFDPGSAAAFVIAKRRERRRTRQRPAP